MATSSLPRGWFATPTSPKEHERMGEKGRGKGNVCVCVCVCMYVCVCARTHRGGGAIVGE